MLSSPRKIHRPHCANMSCISVQEYRHCCYETRKIEIVPMHDASLNTWWLQDSITFP